MTDMNKESWTKRNRVKIQVAALVVGLSCPFLLYAALNAHLPVLAGLLFAILVASIGAVIWQG